MNPDTQIKGEEFNNSFRVPLPYAFLFAFVKAAYWTKEKWFEGDKELALYGKVEEIIDGEGK